MRRPTDEYPVPFICYPNILKERTTVMDVTQVLPFPSTYASQVTSNKLENWLLPRQVINLVEGETRSLMEEYQMLNLPIENPIVSDATQVLPFSSTHAYLDMSNKLESWRPPHQVMNYVEGDNRSIMEKYRMLNTPTESPITLDATQVPPFSSAHASQDMSNKLENWRLPHLGLDLVDGETRSLMGEYLMLNTPSETPILLDATQVLPFPSAHASHDTSNKLENWRLPHQVVDLVEGETRSLIEEYHMLNPPLKNPTISDATQVLPFLSTHASQDPSNKLENWRLPHQVINLVEGETRSLVEEYQMWNPRAENPIKSTEAATSQKLQFERPFDENGGIDLNRTPPQKVKRKKHRPKVVREDKPARNPSKATPKPRTPVPMNELNLNSKRKCEAKSNASNPSGAGIPSVGIPDNSGSVRSVRRSLNFDFEDDSMRRVNTDAPSTVPCTAGNREYIAVGTHPVSFNSTMVQSASTRDLTGNSLLGDTGVHQPHMVNQGLNYFQNILDTPTHESHRTQRFVSGMNQLQTASRGLPEDHSIPMQASRREIPLQDSRREILLQAPGRETLLQTSRREMPRENIKNLSSGAENMLLPNTIDGSGPDVFSKGTKRAFNLCSDAVDSAQISDVNFTIGVEGNQNWEFDGAKGPLCDPNLTSKRRNISPLDEIRSRAPSLLSSPIPCIPGSWKIQQATRTVSDPLTLEEMQRIIAAEKIKESERIFMYSLTGEQPRFNRSMEPQNLNSNANINGNNLPTPMRPSVASWSENIIFNQPRTPENQFKHVGNAFVLSSLPRCTEEEVIWAQMKMNAKRQMKEQVRVSGSFSMNRNGARVCGPQTGYHNFNTSHLSGQTMALAPEYFCDQAPNKRLPPAMQDRIFAKEPRRSSLSTTKSVPPMDPIDDVVQKLLRLKLHRVHEDVNNDAKNALVPYVGSSTLVRYEGPIDLMRKRRPRPKVHLDTETSRVWKLLMLKDSIHDDNELDKDKKKWWEEERQIFRGRVDSFIARMHLVQGDRRFSPWKGSVVDSVVGVFLTQNVSDHLSSSAFMSMAARFPLRSREINSNSKPEVTSTSGGQPTSFVSSPSNFDTWQEKMVGHEFFNQSSISISDVEKIKQVVEHKDELGSETVQVGCPERDGKVHDEATSVGRKLQDSSTDSSVTEVGSTKSVKSDDKRSPDDIASSQTSTFSSQNSEYPVQTDDPAGTSLGLDSEELISRSVIDKLDGGTSFVDLLKMAEKNKFQSVISVDSGRISQTENSDVINNLEQILGEASVLKSNDQLSNQTQQHDFFSVKSISSASSHASGSFNSHYTNEENNSQASAECNYSTSTTSFNPVVSSISGDPAYNVLTMDPSETVYQQSSLSSRLMPSLGAFESQTNKLRQPLGNLDKETRPKEQLCSNHHPQRGSTVSCTNNIFRSSNVPQCGNSSDHQIPSHTETGIGVAQPAANFQLPQISSKINSNFLKSQDSVTKVPDLVATKHDAKDGIVDSKRVDVKTADIGPKMSNLKADKEKNNGFDWDSLRIKFCHGGLRKERSSNAKDSVDWDAVRRASVDEISDTIRERGMNNLLAERIKDFLDRIVKDHGAIDLEWLRDVPPDKAKDYLLNIRGLGLKSVECVRLLTLHHLAFPVDTNVGRISVRLGWVPLQPLPESLQLHLLELYPVLETVQKYLWPRLCTLDQRTLYELHYQLITFGKVFCTKSKPNCNACPMRAECKHFASAFASARLALPGPEENNTAKAVAPVLLENNQHMNFPRMPLPLLERHKTASSERTVLNNSEPIIEEPATPEPERELDPEGIEITVKDIEDAFYEDPDEIPTINLNLEEFTQNLQNYMEENSVDLQDGDMSKALVALSPHVASIPVPKLKNISRLRTEHQVYELPDSHPLLEGLEHREQDDTCSYLLAIWTPGETAQSTEPPVMCCNAGDSGQLCDKNTCFSCNAVREAQTQIVRGTLLIPCRTAMRGSFPLNGTYFQVNEVFADHDSSHDPILVPRKWIWNLPRRTVYFGTSIPTIFKGLTTEGIQHCFWRGFVCVRGFDRTTRAPKPLYARLHFPASKAPKNKKAAWQEE